MQIFLEETMLFFFGAENLDECNFTSQTSCIISKLRRKVYAPTFEIWNIYGLLRCNMHISLERNTFWSQHKRTISHTLSYALSFRHDFFERLPLSQVKDSLLNEVTLRWYHELRTRMYTQRGGVKKF